LQFTYGITIKTIKGKKYSYFWYYKGRRKTEIYLGRSDKLETRTRGLQVKIEYLEGLKKDLDLSLSSAKMELAGLQGAKCAPPAEQNEQEAP
jgi:hypothetical protein